MKTGIWIDMHNAYIIKVDKNEVVEFNHLESDIENYRIWGGSGTKLKGGPQDVIHDSKYLNKKNEQLKRFFKRIVPLLDQAKDIVIFGPAEVSKKLQTELVKNYKAIAPKISDLVKSDNMTENQLKQWVKSYYSI